MLRILVLLVLVLSPFKSSMAKSTEWVYVVTAGDNLWNISKKYLNNVTYFEDVRKLNNINHPRKMQPGTLIRIPLEWVIKHSAKVTVKSLNGKSTFTRNDNEFEVTTEVKFALGDELRVGNKASITLVFADQSEMTLSDGVIVSFDHLTQYGKTGMVNTRVRLSEGKLVIRAEKQHGVASRLDIATASAITSVRGTVFRVGVDKTSKKRSVIEVIEGEVAVSQGTESVAVKQGFGMQVEQGKQLTAPVELLKAPELIAFQRLQQVEAARVQWHTVPNAQSYQVLIAKDPLFSNIIWQDRVEQSGLELPNLNDGLYYLRLTAITASGIEGVPNDNLFELNAFPKPPTPEKTAIIHLNGDQQLRWQPSDKPQLPVLLQISKNQDFNQLVVSKSLLTSHYRPEKDLALGQYFWRIATMEQENSLTHGPFSAVQNFRYSLLLPAPSLKASVKNNQVVVSWKALNDNEYMEIQTSKLADFSNVTLQSVRDKDQVEISLSPDNLTYIRARARLHNEPVPGDWSKPCKISAGRNLAICGV